ncbi:hypothetical protein B484DRAFT_454031 [Ochromonadaceae sp. CCMP2298]|nr:hypothetical protein B484DRAFT_454031 [Ochromonadaceae sp. CCMP2298]
MRRGVANCSGVLEDDAQRVFQARIGYSGALGNMENAAGLAGEQQQLEICMTECQGNLPMMVHWTPTLLVMYVGSLRKSRHLDKALAVLQALEKLPRPFECPAWDVEDRLSRTSNKLGADLYAIGCTLENQVAVAVQGVKAWRAEPPREEWTAESARIHGLLEAALECFQKSCVALGTDELGNKPMAQAACTRVAQMLSLYPH